MGWMHVKQRMNGTFARLLLIYTALEAFRHSGWMLFYERLVGAPRQQVNMGFILYSGAIALTTLLAPRLLRRGARWADPRAAAPVFSLAVCVAIVIRLVQWFASPSVATVLLMLWTAAVMVGICLCFSLVFRQIPRSLLGRFFGIAYCLDSLVVSFIELFTGTPAYPHVSQGLGVVLCAAAIWLFHRQAARGAVVAAGGGSALASGRDVTVMTGTDDVGPTRRMVFLAFATACLYVLMAGAMDNLYFFDDWLVLPYVGLFTLPMMGVMYLAGGFLFDRVHWRITVPAAVAFVCLAQTMPFFAPQGLFAYAYSFFSGLGTTFLQLVVVTMPILLARASRNEAQAGGMEASADGTQRARASWHDGISTPLGEGLFYAGFCLASVGFLFASQAAFRPVMGAILLTGVVCLLLLIEVIALHERDKHRTALERQRLAMEALRHSVTATGAVGLDGLPLYEEAANVRFTKREKELMPYVASSLTAEEIAVQTHVSVSTIRFHIRNILGKTGTRNRRELMRLFAEKSQVEDVERVP